MRQKLYSMSWLRHLGKLIINLIKTLTIKAEERNFQIFSNTKHLYGFKLINLIKVSLSLVPCLSTND